MFQRTLLGALAATAVAGAAIAVKLIVDHKKENKPEEESAEEEIRFVRIDADEDEEEDTPLEEESVKAAEEKMKEDTAAPKTFDAADRSAEVREVAAVYPYLNPDFIEEVLSKNDEFNEKYEEDILVSVNHKVTIESAEARASFMDILATAGYACEEVGTTVTAGRKFFTQSGAIISDILNVANQTAALKGIYEGYEIQ